MNALIAPTIKRPDDAEHGPGPSACWDRLRHHYRRGAELIAIGVNNRYKQVENRVNRRAAV